MMTTLAVVAACTVGAADNPRIIEFTGQGCGACQRVAPVVEQLKQAGCEIHQVDVHQRPDLAQAFGIREIPCFVILSEDRVVDRWVGAASYEELSEFCQRAADHGPVRGQTATPNRPGSIVDHLRERAAFAHRRNGGQPSRETQQFPPGPRQRGLVGAPTVVTHQTTPGSPVYPDFSTEVPPRNPASPGPVTAPAQSSTPEPQVNRSAPVVTAAASAPAVNPMEQVLQATVRVRIEDAQGHSFGTGTVIDLHDHEALILTCGHIFRSSGGHGRITCDFFAGDGTTAEGTLVCYDIRRDVGLISARPGTEIMPVRVGGTGQQPKPGDRVFAVGCNHGDAPSIMENRILAVNRYHGPANLVVGGRPVDGRSGGGLFASDGTLIGVCNAADEQQDEGLYAALGPIHAELDRAGLAFVYRPQESSHRGPTRGGNLQGPPTQFLSNGRSNEIANSPFHSGIAGPTADGRGPTLDASAAANGTTAQAALGSGARAAPSNASEELICIIRSHADGVDQSRVMVIDRPSVDLVSRLSQEVNQRGPHADTNMHVPTLPTPRPGVNVGGADPWAGNWQGAPHPGSQPVDHRSRP